MKKKLIKNKKNEIKKEYFWQFNAVYTNNNNIASVNCNSAILLLFSFARIGVTLWNSIPKKTLYQKLKPL